MPLLHGAHVLSRGDTAQGAGFSGTFAVGDAKAAVRSTSAADQRAASDALSGSAPSGFGFDVPLLVGWRSTAGVVTLWTGVRGGFEKLSADSSSATALDLRRWYGGGVIGLGLGFRHVHGAIELDAYDQSVTGSYAGSDVRVTGVTLTPAAGVILSF